MTRTELDTILREHKLWIDTGGNEGKRANLRGTNLAGANVKGTILDKKS